MSFAVRELRHALGESQQQFALRMETAIRTIARYETVRPPKGRVLWQLAALAHDARQSKLEGIFQSALAEEMGLKVAFSDDSNRFWTDAGVPIPRDLDIEALTWMKRHPDKYAEELSSWATVARVARQEALDAWGLIEAAVKLLREGMPKKVIEYSLAVKLPASARDLSIVRSDPLSARSRELLEKWFRRL